MKTQPQKTMTDLLREAMEEAKRTKQIRTVARATGLNHVSLIRFIAGKSLRLDLADKLAAYFQIESKRKG
jgi:hypothetical protein